MNELCYNGSMTRTTINILELSSDYLKSLKDRMDNKFNITNNGCWEWIAGKNKWGYGKISVKRTTMAAHRVYYQLISGPIPDGLVIDHLCRNRACVNPDHLEPVTMKENNDRGVGVITSINASKTHCKNGHEFTADNTRIRKNGSGMRRDCIQCTLMQDRDRKRKYAIQRGKIGLTSKGTVRKVRYHDRLPLDVRRD